MKYETVCLYFRIENIEVIRILSFKISLADLSELYVLYTCEVVCYI